MGFALTLLAVAVMCLVVGRRRERRARASYEPKEVRLVGRETERRKVVEYGSQTFHFWLVLPSGEARPRRVRVAGAEFERAATGETVIMYRAPDTGRLVVDPGIVAQGWRTAATWFGLAGAVLAVAALALGAG
jgi:hypothetical protein